MIALVGAVIVNFSGRFRTFQTDYAIQANGQFQAAEWLLFMISTSWTIQAPGQLRPRKEGKRTNDSYSML